MIQVQCKTPDGTSLANMTPFQGTLKKRSPKDIAAFSETLKTDGLLMPFVLWRSPSESLSYILDGHGRYQALVQLAIDDASILEQIFPVLFIDAETEEDARKALLQITSMYGRFDKAGVLEFSKTIVNYKAPVLVKVQKKLVKTSVSASVNQDAVLVRIRVPKDKVAQLTALLKQVNGIEVL